MSILVFNAGSTSLKFGLYTPDASACLMQGSIDWPDVPRHQARMSLIADNNPLRLKTVSVPTDADAVDCALAETARFANPTAVGHRVVHGGIRFDTSAWIDNSVTDAMGQLSRLAPLHNPPALAAIRATQSHLPSVPQLAMFDTAFFSRLPDAARYYAVPFEWHEKFGIRRFGFHGISNAYCLMRIAEILQCKDDSFRLITCHLGGGCSATAVKQGQPVATTMGFSPLEGLMMGTRCGSLDPGILLHLLQEKHYDATALEKELHEHSGLLGISGIAADMVPILQAADSGHTRARLAVDLFCDRVRSAIGSLAVSMGGVDVLVFTDRIGEGSPRIRARICDGLECLGIRINPDLNQNCSPDSSIADNSSTVPVWIIKTREEWMIAKETSQRMSLRERAPRACEPHPEA